MNDFKISEFQRLSALAPNALSVDAFSVLSSEVQKRVLSVLVYATESVCERAVKRPEQDLERMLVSVVLRAQESAIDALRVSYAEASLLCEYTHSEQACAVLLICAALHALHVVRKEDKAVRFNTQSSLCLRLFDNAEERIDYILHNDADYFASVIAQTALVYMRTPIDTLH